MIDLHCHILPGLDDGAKDMEESLAMAQSAVDDGITHVVATPHSSSDFSFDYSKVRALRDVLQAKVGPELRIATGCDFHMNPENLTALREQAPPFCINQKSYLLVEFDEFSIPPAMDHSLHELRLAGLWPIITHPERNSTLRAHPERLKGWVRLGCYVQVTAGALTGMFRESAQRNALRWIQQGLVHFVASDAHNTGSRPLRLKPAYELVRERFGREKAQALFVDNPWAAFEGEELPHVPELKDESPSRRKRFFFF
ncbi:MAG: tyrosine protein phosphatase [Candidatus Acidiferrum sp.]